MNRWTRFLGLAGLVIALFGLLGVVVSNSFTVPLVIFHLVLGFLLIVIWLATNAGNLGSIKHAVTGRRSRFAGNAVLYTIVFVGILVVINYFASRNDRRWDLTEAGAYSLSEQSLSLVAGLKQPLRIVGIPEAARVPETHMKDMFGLYELANKKFVSTLLINPSTKPQLLDTYAMKEGNVIYVEYGEGDKKAVSRLNEFSEQAITNAILKLTRGEAKKIYYVQGHDELLPESSAPIGLRNLSDAIRDEHLDVSSVVLSRGAAVPADAAAVILVSPKKPLLPEEKQMLIDYAQKGGRLMMLTDPRSTADVKDIAAHFGIEVGDNVVIDQLQRPFAAPTLGAQPMVLDYGAHAITKAFGQQTPTIFNIATSVRAKGTNDAATTYTELLMSSATAWGETNLPGIFESDDPVAVLEENDVPGPVPLGTVYEKKLAAEPKDAKENQSGEFDKIARIAVFGDADWIMNQNLNVYSNRDLFLNTLNWLAGEEGGVTIRPKSVRASYAPIPRSTFSMLVTSGFVVPEIFLIIGLLLWWKRRTVDA